MQRVEQLSGCTEERGYIRVPAALPFGCCTHMDLSGHEGDLAGMPIPGPYGSSSSTAGNLHDNKLRLLSSGSAPASGNGITLPPPHPPPVSLSVAAAAAVAADDAAGGAGAAAAAAAAPTGGKLKKPVRYRECLKNHAASIGGHALDGCGEFMPSGEEGTMEALKCAACDCHRNFHRREVEGEPLICDICHMNRRERNRRAAAIAAGVMAGSSGQQQSSSLAMPLASSQQVPRGPMNLLALSSRPASGGAAGGESDAELEASLGQHHHHHQHALGAMTPLSMKKRFRTKFSIDQKERMYLFAEKVGWRIQKHDEAAVQQFCADVGVKRHVLKVWMHNNKHTFGKRSMVLPPSSSPPPPSQPSHPQPQQQQQQQQQAIS